MIWSKIDIGFSKIEIATIVKTYGLFATLLGAFLGGTLVYRQGIYRSLLLCGILQMLSNLMFVWQSIEGHNALLLSLTSSIENLSGGMGTAAFVAYISSLCNKEYTATHYALLSSLAAVGRTWLSSSSGLIIDHSNWVTFFIISTVIALPSLILLWYAKDNLRLTPKDKRDNLIKKQGIEQCW